MVGQGSLYHLEQKNKSQTLIKWGTKIKKRKKGLKFLAPVGAKLSGWPSAQGLSDKNNW